MISNIDQRIFKYTAIGTVWTDLTIPLNEPKNGKTAAISMAVGDFIYISSFLPFNHKYFQISVASADSRAPKIEVCSGPAEWSEVIDTLDYTLKMAESGVLQWTPDENKVWGRISRNKIDIQSMTGAPMVYDSYWIRISFPAGAATFTLKYVGHLFSSDSNLYSQYPQLQNEDILEGFEDGKTDWLDQHIDAADYIVKDLIARDLVLSGDQVLDISTFRPAAIHKAAEIIYIGMGAKNFEKEIAIAQARYQKAMTQNRFGVDANMNGRKDISDRMQTTTRATR